LQHFQRLRELVALPPEGDTRRSVAKAGERFLTSKAGDPRRTGAGEQEIMPFCPSSGSKSCDLIAPTTGTLG
jgi:hypothetical protein